MRADLLEQAASEIVDCGYSPDGWSSALDTMALVTGSAGVVILPINGGSAGYLANEPARAFTDEFYAGGWHMQHSLRDALPRLRQTGIMVDHEFQTWDELKNAPIVEGFLRPRGFLHFAACYINSEGGEWWAYIQRQEKQSFFNDWDQSLLRSLLAPLNAVSRITASVARAYSSSFMQLDTPLLLLDRFGRIKSMNRAAEQRLGDVFCIRHDKISVPDETASEAIERHIVRALHAGALEHVPPFIYRHEDAFAVFDVCRLQPPASGPFSPYHAMVAITVPSATSTPNAARARSLFSLTRRETDLALALCQSYGLTSAAKALDMKHETARMHLKSIFVKTRTSSQSELVAVLRATSRQPFGPIQTSSEP